MIKPSQNRTKRTQAPKTPQKVVFNRKKWATGLLRGEVETDDGETTETLGFCALGFYMHQIGFTNAQLEGNGDPGSVADECTTPRARAGFAKRLANAGAEWLVCPKLDPNSNEIVGFESSKEALRVAEINDEQKGLPRERALARLFAKHGVKVEFK